MAAPERLTTSSGSPVDDNQNSLTAGAYGPVLLQDFHLIDKLAHFNRERIPERVVHAKGAGAHGYFEVTNDISHICKAKFLDTVGKRTPVFTRFSTVGGEKGSADTERDPRGFAVKFYTEEGIWDMVGNNTPVFFIRDPIKFPDFIHTQKRNPASNLKDPNAVWDFFTLVPESIHQATILFSNRGTPKSYRHMNGYGSHTFTFVNDEGVPHYIKWHMKTETGIENWKAHEAVAMAGTDPDYATRDLYETIANGGEAAWSCKIQVMPVADAANYRFNPFDVTKVWPHADYPLVDVGRLVLNKNPENYFAETEQSAFSPSHMVPGIEPSPDKMLQARLFAYPDTHRHRLGPNSSQIPINCPYRTKVRNHQRDGVMAVNGNGGGALNYEPNSFSGPVADSSTAISAYAVQGVAARHDPHDHPQDDFVQAGDLYRNMPESEKTDLVNNIVGHLSNAQKFIQERAVRNFLKADHDYGTRVAAGLARTQSRL